MKITISPLQQRIAAFVVEAEPSETIGELKMKISAKQGHPVESQKIFNSGKSLQDDKTIGSYNIKDASQLILILKGAAVSSSDVSTRPPGYTPAPARPTPPEPGSTFSGSGISSNVGASQTNIDEIMNMGMDFTEERVIHALRASFDNPDQAVELLLNGYSSSGAVPSALPTSNFPEISSSAMGLPHTTAPGPEFPQNLLQSMLQPQLGALSGMGGTGNSGDGDSAVPIVGIDPAQVQAIRRMVAENPALTGPLIESIRETDPEEAAHLSTKDADGILEFFNKMGAKR